MRCFVFTFFLSTSVQCFVISPFTCSKIDNIMARRANKVDNKSMTITNSKTESKD